MPCEKVGCCDKFLEVANHCLGKNERTRVSRCFFSANHILFCLVFNFYSITFSCIVQNLTAMKNSMNCYYINYFNFCILCYGLLALSNTCTIIQFICLYNEHNLLSNSKQSYWFPAFCPLQKWVGHQQTSFTINWDGVFFYTTDKEGQSQLLDALDIARTRLGAKDTADLISLLKSGNENILG